ncbi:FAD binding domain-containing protein [Novosphingobium pokkalii]|uniref:FAD binding domain-containing protein n=2 Tax=Novosphingobium pokkalii TaxID=1770194 RepID=A0ABV7V913_9SPHN|nr:FAD binding domain-containing protein [Novosphingobium pokkalii]GHC98171.1 carbon monoxide dehydrogenase [Novosphingobium pokkalii]
MKAAPFDYLEAGSADEAVCLLGEAGSDAAVLAGGQTLMPLLALRMTSPTVLIDINPADDMAGITHTGHGLRIGARTRQADALHDPFVARHLPILGEALGHVGHYQTRARGTVGGSIALGEPAAEQPAVAVALGASIELRSTRGTRQVPAREFYLAPYATARAEDEVVIAIHFPAWPAASRAVFQEVARRRGDFALVGLVMLLDVQDTRVERAGIAWFGMGPTPVAATTAEQALTGATIADIDPRELAQLALAQVEPPEDLHASAHYRRTVAARIFERRFRTLTEKVAA